MKQPGSLPPCLFFYVGEGFVLRRLERDCLKRTLWPDGFPSFDMQLEPLPNPIARGKTTRVPSPLPFLFMWGKDRMGGNKLPEQSDMIKRARELRANATDVERLLWTCLRKRQIAGYRFRRQAPMGRYIVDFVCYEKQLAIELDGGQHKKQAQYDAERTEWLESQGFTVLRFWNNQVLNELEGVKLTIYRHLTK